MRNLNLLNSLKNIPPPDDTNDLSGLPYVDERRNEVMESKPQKTDYSSYADQGMNPLLAYLEQNVKPEYDEEKAQRLKRSAAVNSIGDVLRNVIDAYYGSKGATINKRQSTNPYQDQLLQLQEQYRQDDKAYDNTYLNALMKGMNINREDAIRGEKNARQDQRWNEEDQRFDEKMDWEKEKWKDTKGLKEKELGIKKEDKAQERANKESKDDFPVSNGYDAKGNVKQAYLEPNEVDDVLNYIQGLDNDDSRQVRLFRRGELSKFELTPLVRKYWSSLYDADQDGRMIKKTYTTGKGGYLKENDSTQVNTSAGKTFKVGNRTYNIPSNEVKEFLKSFPNAKEL